MREKERVKKRIEKERVCEIERESVRERKRESV